MNGAGFFLGGILALIAVAVISTVIIAVAPYLAIIIVGISFIAWFNREPEKPPDGDNLIKRD